MMNGLFRYNFTSLNLYKTTNNGFFSSSTHPTLDGSQYKGSWTWYYYHYHWYAVYFWHYFQTGNQNIKLLPRKSLKVLPNTLSKLELETSCWLHKHLRGTKTKKSVRMYVISNLWQSRPKNPSKSALLQMQ